MPNIATKQDWVVQQPNGVTYVELPRERLLKAADMERLCAAVNQAIKATAKPRVVMSFKNVQHIPSVFLGRIVHFNKRVREKGGSFALTNVNHDIYDLLKTTKVVDLVTIIDSPEGGPVAARPARRVAAAATVAVTGLAAIVGLGALVRRKIPRR